MRLLALLFFLHSAYSDGSFFFTAQPADGTVKEGDEHRLYCSVAPADTPGLTYTWYKSSTFNSMETVDEAKLTPLAGEGASILFFPEVQRGDEGYYHCMVNTSEYKIFSRTAYLMVTYFTIPGNPTVVSKVLSDNKDVEYFECDTPESNPETDVVWTKDGETIVDERMFVFPSDYQDKRRGTLMIINAKRTKDGGTYQCHTKEEYNGVRYLLSTFQVTTSAGASTIHKSPSLAYKSHPDSEVSVVTGGAITLVCAATGYPAPQYEWTFQGVDIRTADSVSIEDNGRRLVVSNTKDNGKYECIMSNTDSNGVLQEREQAYYVTLIPDIADLGIDVLRIPTPYNIMKPNLYQPFTLHCSVRATGQIQILWLKNGNQLSWNARITTEETEGEIDGETSTNSNLIFETTNENDLGVYQCVMFNSERLKTETSYVTLETDSLAYEIKSRKPDYKAIEGEFSVDEAEEICTSNDMHLVSIMGEEENAKVQKLLLEMELDSVWIGLTRENPHPEGSWLWTHPGDIATSYSNWDDDKPDNKYGYQEYAVMQADTGKWLDVDKSHRKSAVCKRYIVVCPSLDEFYEGSVRVRGWESTGAQYEVGEEVEIYCRYPGPAELKINHVTCGINGKFEPASIPECPAGNNSARSPGPFFLVLLLSALASL